MHSPIRRLQSLPPALIFIALSVAGGCTSHDDDGQQAVGASAADATCTSSLQCKGSQNCVGGACVEATHCASLGCSAGQVCGPELRCMSLKEACAMGGGCTCHFVDRVGKLSAGKYSGSAHTLPSGASLKPEVVFTTRSGQVIAQAAKGLEVTDHSGAASSAFSVEGAVLTAGDHVGTAVLRAYADDVSCAVTVSNLGPAPEAGKVRVFAFDQANGAPVQGAEVVVDNQGGGVDVGDTPPTNDAGVTATRLAVSGRYTVTVFAAGFDYLSVAGLDADHTHDLQLPLQRVLPLPGAEAPAAMQRSDVNFTAYEQAELDGGSRSLAIALAGLSMPVANVLNFSFDPAVLTQLETCIPGPDQACFDLTTNDPAGAEMSISLPIPAPFLLKSNDLRLKSSLPVKDFLSLPADHGLRMPWVWGGEFPVTDILILKGVVQKLMLPLAGLYQDVGSAPRDGMEALAQFLPKLSLGLWDQAQEVAAGVPASMTLRSPMRHFTDLEVPAFTGDLDTLFVISGADAPGLGFVPLGLGVGMDCMQGTCLAPTGNFSHSVKGIALCKSGLCPPGMPDHTDEHHLPFFQAKPFAGLESRPQLTIAVALSLHQIMQEKFSASGFVLPEAVDGDRSAALAAHSYLPTPKISDMVARRYLVGPKSASTAARSRFAWVAFLGLGDPQWKVFVADGTTDFVLPTVPQGWDDVPENLSVTHTEVELDNSDGSADLPNLLQVSGGLSNFSHRVRAFSVGQQQIGSISLAP